MWRERFSNASDWVFAISGDFDLSTARNLAERHIGALAGSGATEQYKDFQIDPPSTVVTKEVHAGTGDRGSLTLDWNAPTTDSATESVYADVLASVLNIRLTDHIREELGGDPAKIPQISTIVIDDISKLRTVGPTAAEFASAIAENTESYQYFDNETISDLLVRAPKRPELISRFKDRASVLGAITPVTLQKFIAEVMPLDQYIEVRTLPA